MLKGSGVIDLGAQFCHGTDNFVYDLANPAGLLRTEFQNKQSTGWARNVQPAYPSTGRTLTREQWLQYRSVADQIYLPSIRSNLPLGTCFNQT